MKFNQDYFNILRLIKKKPDDNQRTKKFGISLGKFNYCLKALKQKGLIKIRNFKKNKKKHRYFYILTPQGISVKTRLTLNFMKQKMKEYDDLKKEMKEQ